MGANLRTFHLPRARLEEVAAPIGAWLSAKGFEPIERPPPVRVEHLAGRGFALTENERGVTIAYSDPWGEGDRLLFELKKLGPIVLECWLHDSDLWGYSLYRDRELVAAFCSNPRYFGSDPETIAEGLPLPRNGDARLLLETLGLPEKEDDLRKLQTRRAIFAETLTASFAELLDVPALAIDFVDWQELGLADLHVAPAELAGHRVQSFVHVPRRVPGEKRRGVHDVPARPYREPTADGGFGGEPFEMTEGMLWTIAAMRAIALPLSLMIRLAMLPVALLIRLRPRWILGWMTRQDTSQLSPLMRALWDRAQARESRGVTRDGDAYVNEAFGLSIVPAGGVTVDATHAGGLFLFDIQGARCGLTPCEFSMFEMILGALPGEPIEDLRETVDGLPLRIVICESERHRNLHPREIEKRRRRPSWNPFARRADPDPAPSDDSPPPLLVIAAVQEERYLFFLQAVLFDDREASAEALKQTLRTLRRAPGG